jgi:hypothetical protein
MKLKLKCWLVSGTTLLDDEDVVVLSSDAVPTSVTVYWTRPHSQHVSKREPTGQALMWGRITHTDVTQSDVKVNVTQDNDVGGGGDVTYSMTSANLVDPSIVIVDEVCLSVCLCFFCVVVCVCVCVCVCVFLSLSFCVCKCVLCMTVCVRAHACLRVFVLFLSRASERYRLSVRARFCVHHCCCCCC